MRRGLARAAVVVGAVGVLVGLVVAVVVGPDDTVARSPHRLPAQGSQPSTALMAYSAWPRLFSYRDLTLVVTARGGGSVFLGTANPVDAASYADGVRSYRFSEITSGGRITGGRASDGTQARPAVAPTKTTFWTSKAVGSGEARLRVLLDGTPVSVVALSERGPLALGFGVRFAGLFRTALAVLLVGLLLVGYGAWRLRRLRRRATVEPIATRTAGVAAGGLALLLLASGCGRIPETIEPRTPTKIPLTKSELQGVLDDYDRRNNAAIKASETRFNATLWSAADSGSLLAADLFQTKLQRLREKKGDGKGGRTEGLRLYAPAGRTYPLTVIAAFATTDTKEADVEIGVYSRACVICSWKLATSSAVPKATPPPPLAPGRASTPTEEQRKATATVQADLTRYLTTGRSRVVAPAGGLKKFRTSLTVKQPFTSRVEAGPHAEDAVTVARVRGGALTVLQHRFTQTLTVKGDSTLYWTEKASARALDQADDHAYLTVSGVLTTVVSLPERGSPVVLGVSSSLTGP